MMRNVELASLPSASPGRQRLAEYLAGPFLGQLWSQL